ncbi:MAG: N-formylglutamate amidohydrolase [Micavibrio sp.]|nr:N-formylglutamate amidohydrolase [Micavibrio sp.]
MATTNIYSVAESEKPSLLVFDSPHSGRIYPKDFAHACSDHAMHTAEDRFVDLLFDDAPRYGASFLKAEFPRTYIDVNRTETDIDTQLIDEKWPGPLKPTIRAQTGIGLIRRMLQKDLPLYKRYLTVAEIKHRIEHYYKPYHKKLAQMIDETVYANSLVFHINCHSMPSHTSPFIIGKNKRYDFVIGDRDGQTANLNFSLFVKMVLEQIGYDVALNNPFKGVEILRRYGKPHMGMHSIQLEINKTLYLDEETQTLNSNFDKLKNDLNSLTNSLYEWSLSQLIPMAAD